MAETQYILTVTKQGKKEYIALPSGGVAPHNQAWSTITDTPTTLAGYGITDGGGAMEWPGAGIPLSTGASPWGTSYTTTGSGTVIALAASPSLSGNITLPGGIWNTSGNVGIGNASPSQMLHIYKAGNTANLISFGNDEWHVGNLNTIDFKIYRGATAQILLKGDTGNVGIGTDTPREKLTVSGGFIVNRPSSNIAGGTNGLIGFGPSAASYSTLNTYMAGINEGAGWYSGTALVFYTHAGPDTTIGLPTEKLRISKDGNIGIGFTSPLAKIAINGGLHVGGESDPGDNNLWIDGIAQEPNFISGWQGNNWQIQADGDAEFNNVLIRGGLSVYELIINQLHYQNGGLIIGAGAGKVATIETATVGSEVVTFHDPEGNDMVPFTAGAIVMVQRVDISKTVANGYTGDVVKKIVRQVASVSGMEVTLTSTAGWTPGDPAGDDTGIIEVGDELCAIGHVSNTSLDSALYLSATDSDNPFLRVMDGVSSYAKWSLGDKTTCKLQLGNLASLASYDIIPASPGYGIYCDNAYLNGRIVLPTAGMTNEGSSASDIRIYAGDSYANRAIAPFRVTQDGSLTATGVAEIGTATAVMDGKTSNLAIIGPHLWENAYDGDESSLHINYYSYNATHDHYRTLVVYGGKEVIGRYGDPVVHKLLSIQGGDINSIELGNSVHYPDLLIGLCGNIENSWANQYVYAYSGVSDTVILSHNAEVTETGTSYAKKKTITLGSYIKPNRTLRIKFNLKANANISYAQIYRNGSAVGTEKSTASVIYLTFSEDITGWDPSDRIELYVKSTAGNTASACNLRVCGTMVTTIQNEVTGTNS